MPSTAANSQSRRSEREASPRGPRPLPLHLLLAAWTCLSSPGAWRQWRNGWNAWNPELAEQAARLARDVRQAAGQGGEAPLAQAVDRAARERLEAFLAGLEAYRAHPYRRAVEDPKVLGRQGATRLLDYGTAKAGRPLLVIPSLVNRAYILDLDTGSSLLRFLAREGFRPILVDWGAVEPAGEEADFSLSDYIAGRLDWALDVTTALPGGRPVVLGYCMGGLLALALAQRRAGDLSGLVALATPWDFHAGGQEPLARLAGEGLPALEPLLASQGLLPVDVVQALFTMVDPMTALRKFVAFSRLDPAGAQARRFVALEDWLNDGVALAAPVARECLGGWYGRNKPAAGRWRVAGRTVHPPALDLPALCVLPARDRIVPPASAAALARALPRAEVQSPAVGHIGMVVSARAPEAVWRPLVEWLRKRPER